MREVEARSKNGDVVVGVVVVGAGFAGEAHASKGTKLTGDVGLEPEVVVLEKFWDTHSGHLENFEDDCLTALGLVKGGVVVADVRSGGRRKVLLGPGG